MLLVEVYIGLTAHLEGDNMSVSIDPILLLPNEKSTSDEWIQFYNALVNVYGTSAAIQAFVLRWAKRGTNGAADVIEVEKGTGLNLSKNFLQNLEQTGSNAVSYIGGFFNTMGTGTKIVFYSAIGIAVILVGGLAIRIITLSASDAGKVAGTAAKAALV